MPVYLGDDLYDAFLANIQAGEPYDAAMGALLPYCQRAVAWAAMVEYLPYSNARIREAGPKNLTGQNTATPSTIDGLIYDAANQRDAELENLVNYLRKNSTTYPTWKRKPASVTVGLATVYKL